MRCRQDLTTVIRVSFAAKALSIRQLLVREMLCDNICFMLMPSSLCNNFEFLDRSKHLSDQSRHLFPDRFRESILHLSSQVCDATVTFSLGLFSFKDVHSSAVSLYNCQPSLHGKWTLLFAALLQPVATQSAFQYCQTFTHSCTHEHTDGGVSHAGRQPARQEQSG